MALIVTGIVMGVLSIIATILLLQGESKKSIGCYFGKAVALHKICNCESRLFYIEFCG
ncbi:MAG: hypothetical protein R2877_06225 [Bdellovibrionota bacterium]